MRRPALVRIVTVLLALLGTAYLVEGFARACFGPLPQDLGRRWLENAYFVRGINSFDVFAGTVAVQPDIGPVHPGGYPPWSLIIGLFVAPPIEKRWLGVYFALLNALAFAAVVWFARSAAAPQGRPAQRLAVASVMAISTNAVVLRNGQYGLVINGFLVGLLVALEAGRPFRAGAWLAAAALKPQSSGPFALLFLVRRRWLGLVATAAVLVACGFAAAGRVGSNPISMLSQMVEQASHWEGGDAGLFRVCLSLGVPRGRAIAGLAALSMLAGAVLLHVYRARSLLVQMAIACVVTRIWAYHRRYDDLVLVFLLLPLALEAFERSTKGAWLAFVGVGLTLWLPLREIDHGLPLILAKVFVWFGGLAHLLHSPFGERAVPASPS